MNVSYAKQLIRKNKEYFEENAERFSQSREYIWPGLKQLKKYIHSGETILDLGCGNGRLFQLFKHENVKYFGIDFSEKIIQQAREKYGDHFQLGDMFSLPFSANYFDTIWSIAVFHHIPSRELRLKALREMKRVLKPNGRIIVSCWNLYQLQYLKLLFKFSLRKFLGLTKLDFKDILISPKNLNIQRYYHSFTKKELKKLVIKAGFKVEELRYLKPGNKKKNILIIARDDE